MWRNCYIAYLLIEIFLVGIYLSFEIFQLVFKKVAPTLYIEIFFFFFWNFIVGTYLKINYKNRFGS